ncbi:MAG: hypothetical protein L0H84_13805 [Pseudonocardia sp.]|nr:hypothetical protein [Pseudonocardia sp.]
MLLCAVVLAACGTSAGPEPTGTSGPSATVDEPVPNASTGSGRVLLWPFADQAAVAAWQESYHSGGSQPWHLDAAATALGFTEGYLGFAGVDRVTSTELAPDEAWIGVGYALPGDGREATAAVLHLVRVGAGQDAPWAVVGTRDSFLTIDTPAYGSAARWPLTVGGTITGVDESLHVRVLGLDGLAGEVCCVPAGGEKSPWSVEVPLGTTRAGDLTVVVATGGHVADVERFAITAVTGGGR